MKTIRNTFAFSRVPLLAGALIVLIVFVMGCLEYDNTSPTGNPATEQVSGSEAGPERPQSNEPSAKPSEDPPALKPEPEPPSPPAPTEHGDIFRYEPGTNTVTIYVPRQFGMWQLTIVSLRPHHYLWGPNKTRGYPVVVPIGGAELARMSRNVSNGPAILVYANTSNETTGAHASVGWRIPDPTRSYRGDGTRLREGENH